VIHKIFPFGGKNRNENQIEIGCYSWEFIIFIFPSSFRISSVTACIQMMNQRSKTAIILEIEDKIHDMILIDR